MYVGWTKKEKKQFMSHCPEAKCAKAAKTDKEANDLLLSLHHTGK
jgi:hypothetical protein